MVAVTAHSGQQVLLPILSEMYICPFLKRDDIAMKVEIINMERKKNYRNKRVKPYKELEPFLNIVVSFKRNDNCKDIINTIDDYNFEDNRVWALFGSNDNENWDCLQVAQTKKNISQEIKCDIEFMFENKYEDLLSQIEQKDRIIKNTTFYNGSYEMGKGSDHEKKSDPRKFSYSKMYSEYKFFRICILKINEYLSFSSLKLNEDLVNILEIAKPLYAEAKLAYDTLAKYWNMYNSGVDGQAIIIFLERDQQCV